jgi:hypothetical protein
MYSLGSLAKKEVELPVGDNTTLGLSKLYSSKGEFEDGSISQKVLT